MHTGIDVHNEGDTLIMGVSANTKQYQHMANGSFFIPYRNGFHKAQCRNLNPSLIRWLSGCFER